MSNAVSLWCVLFHRRNWWGHAATYYGVKPFSNSERRAWMTCARCKRGWEVHLDALLAKQLQASLERNARMTSQLRGLYGSPSTSAETVAAIEKILRQDDAQ